MEKIFKATYDGEVFRPNEPVDLDPDTEVTVHSNGKENRPLSFLQTARSLKLRGPSDFSSNLDDYLYGGKPIRDEE